MSGHLELSPGSVDDHDFFCALSCSPCSKHAAASPFGPLNHSNDFFRPSCRSRLYITGTGKYRYAGFCLELQTPMDCRPGLRAPSTLDIATQILLTAI